MTRWVVTLLIMVLLRDYYAIQIMCLLFLSIMSSTLLVRGRPFLKPLDNYMQILNEAMICTYLYIMLILTEFNTEITFKDQIGWCLLGTIFLNVSTNLVKALFVIGKGTLTLISRRLQSLNNPPP